MHAPGLVGFLVVASISVAAPVPVTTVNQAQDACSNAPGAVVRVGATLSVSSSTVVNFDGQGCTLDGQGQRRVMMVNRVFTASNVTFAHGSEVGSGGTPSLGADYELGRGGGVCMSANGVFLGCTFQSNTAVEEGGGVAILSSCTGTFSTCVFFKNTAKEGGGASMVPGGSTNSGIFVRCAFNSNTAANDGGGVYILSAGIGSMDGSFTSCAFHANAAESSGTNRGGGAVHMDSKPRGSLEGAYSNCTFKSNTAASDGGGVYMVSSQKNINGLFSTCTFESNIATTTRAGGGMYMQYSAGILSGCMFYNNSAKPPSDYYEAAGGGIGVSNSATTWSFIDCIFHANTASFGSGVNMNEHARGSFSRCTFRENRVSKVGGGVNVQRNSQGSFSSCNFLANVAKQPHNEGYGGGMAMRWGGSGYVSSCTFNENTASGVSHAGGGGVFMRSTSTGTFSSCSFHSNTVFIIAAGPTDANDPPSASAGGVFMDDNCVASFSSCNFYENAASGSIGGGAAINMRNCQRSLVFNCIFKENKARNELNGGAVSFSFSAQDAVADVGYFSVDACHFVGNVADFNGGGVFIWWAEDPQTRAESQILRTTFASCSALRGGAVFVSSKGTQGQVAIKSCMFLSNTACSSGSVLAVHVRDNEHGDSLDALTLFGSNTFIANSMPLFTPLGHKLRWNVSGCPAGRFVLPSQAMANPIVRAVDFVDWGDNNSWSLNIQTCPRVCPVGRQSTGNNTTLEATQCRDCPVGFFNGIDLRTAEDPTTEAVCTRCAAGRYLDQTKGSSDACKECSAGRFTSSGGQTICTFCPPGFVQPDYGQKRCWDNRTVLVDPCDQELELRNASTTNSTAAASWEVSWESQLDCNTKRGDVRISGTVKSTIGVVPGSLDAAYFNRTATGGTTVEVWRAALENIVSSDPDETFELTTEIKRENGTRSQLLQLLWTPPNSNVAAQFAFRDTQTDKLAILVRFVPATIPSPFNNSWDVVDHEIIVDAPNHALPVSSVAGRSSDGNLVPFVIVPNLERSVTYGITVVPHVRVRLGSVNSTDQYAYGRSRPSKRTEIRIGQAASPTKLSLTSVTRIPSQEMNATTMLRVELAWKHNASIGNAPIDGFCVKTRAGGQAPVGCTATSTRITTSTTFSLPIEFGAPQCFSVQARSEADVAWSRQAFTCLTVTEQLNILSQVCLDQPGALYLERRAAKQVACAQCPSNAESNAWGCTCSSGFYRLNNTHGPDFTCEPCVDGAICKHGKFFLQRNFWASSHASRKPIKCTTALACPGDRRTTKNASRSAICREFHEDVICGVCTAGTMPNRDNICLPCTTEPWILPTFFAIITLVVVVFLLFMVACISEKKSGGTTDKDLHSASRVEKSWSSTMSLVFVHAQRISSFGVVFAGIEWPSELRKWFDLLTAATLRLLSALRSISFCALGLSFTQRVWAAALFFVWLLAVMAVVLAIGRRSSSVRSSTQHFRMGRIFVFVYRIAIPEVSSILFQGFMCRHFAGVGWRLANDLSLECSTAKPKWVAIVATCLTAIVVYHFGIQGMLLADIVKGHRHEKRTALQNTQSAGRLKSSASSLALPSAASGLFNRAQAARKRLLAARGKMTATLTGRFKRRYWWWYVVMPLVQRQYFFEQAVSTALLALLVTLKFSPTPQLATALLISATALNFAGCAPYKQYRDNTIEAIGNWIYFLVLLSGLLKYIYVNTIDTDEGLKVVDGAITTVYIGGVVVVFLFTGLFGGQALLGQYTNRMNPKQVLACLACGNKSSRRVRPRSRKARRRKKARDKAAAAAAATKVDESYASWAAPLPSSLERASEAMLKTVSPELRRKYKDAFAAAHEATEDVRAIVLQRIVRGFMTRKSVRTPVRVAASVSSDARNGQGADFRPLSRGTDMLQAKASNRVAMVDPARYAPASTLLRRRYRRLGHQRNEQLWLAALRNKSRSNKSTRSGSVNDDNPSSVSHDTAGDSRERNVRLLFRALTGNGGGNHVDVLSAAVDHGNVVEGVLKHVVMKEREEERDGVVAGVGCEGDRMSVVSVSSSDDDIPPQNVSS